MTISMSATSCPSASHASPHSGSIRFGQRESDWRGLLHRKNRTTKFDVRMMLFGEAVLPSLARCVSTVMSFSTSDHVMATHRPLSFEGIHGFMDTLFGEDLHAKRVLSLTGATLGVIESASLAVGLIGQGLALARGRLTKHAIKQVDRLLSNHGIDVDTLLAHWVPYVVGNRTSITLAMDWTDFDADNQATIMLSLLCRHGRATPLVRLTVDTTTLKDRRNDYEYQVLVRLAEVLPAAVRVRIVADQIG